MRTTQEENLIKSISPNYVGNGIFLNPNPNKDVKESAKLNYISQLARETDFFKKFVSQEGFELSPADFKWEWIINFNNKSGFMVLREYDNHLRFFVYKTKDDLNWKEFLIKDFNLDNRSVSRLISLIKQERQFIN
jgi:hypothetical protein